jgi:hypothetical protein
LRQLNIAWPTVLTANKASTTPTYLMKMYGCLQQTAMLSTDITLPFALSEKPLSVPNQTRPLSARLKAKRDRGESIDFMDLANGDLKQKLQCDAVHLEPRNKRSKASPKLKSETVQATKEVIPCQDCENSISSKGSTPKESISSALECRRFPVCFHVL